MWIQSRDRGEELIEGVQVKFIREDLGDNWVLLAKMSDSHLVRLAFQEIFLRKNVATLDNLLK